MDEIPEGCSTPDFKQKPVTLALPEGEALLDTAEGVMAPAIPLPRKHKGWPPSLSGYLVPPMSITYYLAFLYSSDICLSAWIPRRDRSLRRLWGKGVKRVHVVLMWGNKGWPILNRESCPWVLFFPLLASNVFYRKRLKTLFSLVASKVSAL